MTGGDVQPLDQMDPGVPEGCLRLFVSVDVVGSTAHKQRTIPTKGENHANPWLKTFTEFYAKVEHWVAEEWLALPKRIGKAYVGDAESLPVSASERDALAALIGVRAAPVFWKAIGDEMVFVFRVPDLRIIVPVIDIFCRVVHRLQRDLKAVGLTAKATAWIAEFPVVNSEIVLGNRADDKLSRAFSGPAAPADWFYRHFYRVHLHRVDPDAAERLDFLGPQIDLGFRLCQHASPRRMALSLDLAALIAKYSTWWAMPLGALHFDGSHELKGILGGVPYPVFWLDCGQGPLYDLHDKLMGKEAVKPAMIAEYQQAFVAEFSGRFPWITTPFIVGIPGQDEGYGEYHRARRAKLDKRWSHAASTLAAPPPPPTPTGDSAPQDTFMATMLGPVTPRVRGSRGGKPS